MSKIYIMREDAAPVIQWPLTDMTVGAISTFSTFCIAFAGIGAFVVVVLIYQLNVCN